MSALTELRVLEGPNLYFPRAAIKLTLDVGSLTHADEGEIRALSASVGARRREVGAAGSQIRQRIVMRLLESVVRRLAADAGAARRLTIPKSAWR